MQNVITACKKTTANSSILTILMLTIKTVKSKLKKPLSPLMGKGRGKKLAAELLLKAIATTKLKPLFAESLNSMVPVKQKDSPIV
jgi:proteasome assembly chaperone (PAC2) family protein